MKPLAASVIFAAFSLAAGRAPAQTDVPDAETPPAYTATRYGEDYRYLRDPAMRTDDFDALKYIPLSEDSYVSLGGEYRGRYEAAHNPGFNFDGSVPRDDFLLVRIQGHADLHLGADTRFFAQIGSYQVLGALEAAPANQRNTFDVQQLFGEVGVPLGINGARLSLRGGRQEMSYGSSRLVSISEGPNVHRRYDGARATWRSHEEKDAITIDVFLTRPVEPRRGALDDRSNPEEMFWGIYGALPAARSATGLDLYYLGLKRSEAAFVQGAGRERRHTLGGRLFGTAGAFDWDAEFAIQFGRLHAVPIRAGAIAADLGYALTRLPWTPRLGFRADLQTGDADPSDGKLETFNPLFARRPYHSEASLITPANLFRATPIVSAGPGDDLQVSLGWSFLSRHRRRDGFYGRNGAPIAGDAGSRRTIGRQWEGLVEWKIDRHIVVEATLTYFDAAASIRSLGGNDVASVFTSIAFVW